MNTPEMVVLYTALCPETVKAEVRSEVGGFIAVAELIPNHCFKVLDLTRLGDYDLDVHYCDPGVDEKLNRQDFLQGFADRLARPVDLETDKNGYLATQAISKYLQSKVQSALDGIKYKSAVHNGGMNILLFQHMTSLTPDHPEFPISKENVIVDTDDASIDISYKMNPISTPCADSNSALTILTGKTKVSRICG